MSVYAKLAKAKAMIHKLPLKKSGVNRQYYQDKKSNEWKVREFYYFELGDFMADTMNIFAEVGICGVETFIPSKVDTNGVVTPELYKLTIVDAEDESTVEMVIPTAEADMKSVIQGLGAKCTYLRRYVWLMALDLAENDLVDAQGNENASIKNDVEPAQTADDVAYLTEFVMVRNQLTSLGIDVHSEQFASYLEKNCGCREVDPAKIEKGARQKVLTTLKKIYEVKAKTQAHAQK